MSEYPKIMYEKNIDGKPEPVRVIGCDLSSAECTIPTYIVQSGPGSFKSRYSPSILFNTTREVLDKSIMEFRDAIKINKAEILGHKDTIELLIKRVLELEDMRDSEL